jgi:hypothetical protein
MSESAGPSCFCIPVFVVVVRCCLLLLLLLFDVVDVVLVVCLFVVVVVVCCCWSPRVPSGVADVVRCYWGWCCSVLLGLPVLSPIPPQWYV